MDEPLVPLEPDRGFRFACTPQAPCFNACCRELCQALSPYDALRLRGALGLSGAELVGRYGRIRPGPGSGMPVLILAPADRRSTACPFVADAGCRVYADRPASCRTYPLVRLARRSRATGAVTSDYFLLREPHCRGFTADAPRRTAAEWVADQGLAAYDRWNDRLLELISLKNRRLPGALPTALYDEIAGALYDLDGFRERFFRRALPPRPAPPFDEPEAAAERSAELALLAAAFDWAAARIAAAGPTTAGTGGEAP